jgi:hypothetical protein
MNKQQQMKPVDRSVLKELIEQYPSSSKEHLEGSPQPERRDHRRYELEEPVGCDVRHVQSTDRTDNPCIGSIQDVSRGGLCLLTDHPLQEGSRLEVDIDLQEQQEAKGVLRVVRRSKRGPDRYEIGARFERLTAS